MKCNPPDIELRVLPHFIEMDDILGKKKKQHMLPLHPSLKCIKIKEIILDMAVVYQIQPCV